MGPKKKNSIPDRWTDYKAAGKRIPGTRFIAFKVPLKRALWRHLHESEVFGPLDLMDVLKKEGEELGLIIDLTFTTRYYQPQQDLPDTLHYLKIFTAGHEVPSDSTILSFKKAVRRFLRDNQNNDKLIGVHCTHGLNRTGYLVCRYLIDVDGVEPHKAIDLFNKSRGHSIERQNYLDDLKSGPKRSNDGMEEPEQEPVRGGATNRRNDSTTVQEPHPPFRRRDVYWDHFEPFNQRRSNNQMRSCPPPQFHTPSLRAPPPLLPTPPFRGPPPLLPTPPPPGAWYGYRSGHYPSPPPNPPFMPRYTFGEEPHRHTCRKKHRTSHKHNTNSPY
ncbi:hypothetical protein KOW79_014166 [Hemibagrus wyckioides]|uniref:RNA/RNP complex-1-interacting phosphatase n=1 Tax=Hemibagrus wyckioides TaxID=337641 RepID=A0A9D3SGD2_9TELE|nr:RNA/RNP complex-1-interacting phosphatase isoform X1 [Hemibagrus wyckioides]KAG7322820.1 hypothetical protein KOW79_014166 [Hemibagrus wyckioides]